MISSKLDGFNPTRFRVIIPLTDKQTDTGENSIGLYEMPEEVTRC